MKCKVNPQKIHFKTFGCKVNQYETQLLREMFLKADFYEGSRKESQIYIVNTCSLTKNTDRKVRQYINEIKSVKPAARILVIGCGVFNSRESGLRNLSGIEIFAGRDKKELFKKIVLAEHYPVCGISSFEGRERAFVKVQDGCDNFCSYCVVPYLRGRPVSRPEKEILDEIKNLVDNRFKEIILCGINLGAYGAGEDRNLARLLKKILFIKKNFRLRLSSIEPNFVTEELINLMADDEKFCPHLHVPLQSGDDKILKLMNRKYTIKDYFLLLDKVRKKVKNISFTTDVLVGFPGETKYNFKNTLKAVEKADFLKTHIFSYSLREKTASVKFDGHLLRQDILKRRREAEVIAREVSFKFRKNFLDKKLSVLIEKRKTKDGKRYFGFTDNYIEVELKARNARVNNICAAKIIQVRKNKNLAVLC